MYRSFFKRFLDIFFSFIFLVLLSPFFFLISVGILVIDGGPVIFTQDRIGINGRKFNFYKFRTMPNGTRNIESVELNGIKLNIFSKLLRRTNLDELPQLFNIFRGDMSFIGPRPCLPTQLDLIELRKKNNAIKLLPGLSGLAQVRSYDGMSVAKKAEFDGIYFVNISLLEDIKILLKTFLYLLKPPPKY